MTRREIRGALFIAVLVLAGIPTRAQQSSSFKLTEHVFNAGGDPSDGMVLTSTSHRMTLDSVGEGLIQSGLSSSSHRMDGGFVGAYPPPGEVGGLRFSSHVALQWSAEPSVGVYNLYRGLESTLPGDYGSCEQPDLTAATTTDADIPGPSSTFFYLVTAENRLEEEGTKGFASSGTERPNPSPCP